MSISMSMSCIHGYPSLNSHLKSKHKLQTNTEQLCLSKPRTLVPLHTTQRFASLRTFAIGHNSLVLGLTSPAKSGDISVFLQTSAVMLVLYLITNFVVPNIISKSLEFDEEKEDQSPKA